MANRFAIDEDVNRFAITDPGVVTIEPEFADRDKFAQSAIDELVIQPDKIWDPLRRGQIASGLIDSLAKPSDVKRDSANRIMLSSLFDIPMEDMAVMDKTILKFMYGDELTSMAERFRKRPVEGGFFKKMGEALKRGNEHVSSDIAVYQAVFEGKGNPQEIISIRNKHQLEQLLSPIEGNRLSELFYKSGQVIPGMVRGYWDAVPEAAMGMLIGAGGAAVVGQAGPQVLLPEEIITVPAGAVIGLKAGLNAGSLHFWFKQGAGAMVATMLGEGYDMDLARNVAGIAAIPYALIELSQVSRITPGLRKSINTAINKSVLRVVGRAVKKYGITLTAEVLEEIGQEIIQISAEDIAGILSDADIEFDRDYIISRSARIWETAKESTQAMALLPAPGMGIDVFTGIKGILPPQQRAEINNKVPPVLPLDDILNQPVRITVAGQAGEQAPGVQREGVEIAAAQEPTEGVTATLAKLQAEVDAKKKIADGVPLEPAERTQFPELAAQEEQIAELEGKVRPIVVTDVKVPEGITISDVDIFDSRQGESFGRVIATDKDGKVVGSVDFSEFDDEIAIKFIEVVPELRREGIATALRNKIKEEFPESEIVTFGDIETEEGAAFREAQIPPAPVAEPPPITPRVEVEEEVPVIPEPKRIISKEAFDSARARFRDSTKLRTGLDPQQLTDAAIIGGFLIESGVRKFSAWSAEMITNLGESIRPHLQSIWGRIQTERDVEAVQIPGLTKAEVETLGRREAAALRAAQKRGEKVGFKAGERASREKAKVEIQKLKAAQKLTEGRRKTAVELVKAFVEKDQRGAFLKRVAEAKTPRDLEKLTGAVEKGVARAEKREAITNLNKAVKAIKPKRMLPEFAGPAQAIIDSLQLGKLREDTVVSNAELKEMAQQVLDQSREDSIAAFQAEQLLNELRGKTAKTFAVNQLSIEALEQITDTLTALRFQNEADTIAAKAENATEAIRRRQLIKQEITEPPTIPDKFGGAAVKKFKLIHDNLESVTDAVGGARPGTYDLWKASKRAITQWVYDVLDKGVDNQVIHNRQAGNILRGILADNGVTKKEILSWSTRPENVSKFKKLLGIAVKPEVHTFTLQDARGKKVEFEFTANELMSIFMHSRNNHNLSVLLGDGIDRFVKGKKQKIRGFTVEIIDNMIDALTTQQKTVARQVGSQLMDGFNRDSLNETSRKLEFFDVAKVENYWPARRSIIKTPKGEALKPALSLIENMGILKERVGIGNPMRLAGFFETVHASNRNVSTYVGLAEPLREAKAVLSTDVIAEMEDSGREAESKRIIKHIEKIEGQLVPVFETELDEIVSKMIGGFARAKLFLNLKIAPRQQISQFLISAYVEPKHMTAFRGASSKKLIAEISELSPQMSARIDGFQFDRDVGDAFQENELLHYLTGDISLIDKAGLGMRFFDTNAIVDDYRAVKAEVTDKNPGIDINSEEGKALLKDRFEWVVRHTQPMWHVKDRSLLGASRNPLTRVLTMFMSQREQMVRMVNNGISDFANSEKTLQDATRLGKALGAVTMNMIAFTIYNFAWALLIQRRKKDVEDLGRDFFKDILSLPFFGKYPAKGFEMTFNFLTDKPVFNKEFDAGAVESILAGILLDAIPNFARAGQHFVTGEKYQRGPNRGELKWPTELLVATDALIDAFAALKGLPYYGAKDIVKSVKAQITGGDRK